MCLTSPVKAKFRAYFWEEVGQSSVRFILGKKIAQNIKTIRCHRCLKSIEIHMKCIALGVCTFSCEFK